MVPASVWTAACHLWWGVWYFAWGVPLSLMPVCQHAFLRSMQRPECSPLMEGQAPPPFAKCVYFEKNLGFFFPPKSALISYHSCLSSNGDFFFFCFAAMTVKTLDYHNLIHPRLIYTLWTCCAPKLWLKINKWQTPSKLPWATGGDLGDWITLNYPKPLCRCKSRCEKTNYCFQLVRTAESSQRAKPGERRTQPAFQPAKGDIFSPNTHVAGCSVSHDGSPDTERTLDVYASERKQMSTGPAEASGRG